MGRLLVLGTLGGEHIHNFRKHKRSPSRVQPKLPRTGDLLICWSCFEVFEQFSFWLGWLNSSGFGSDGYTGVDFSLCLVWILDRRFTSGLEVLVQPPPPQRKETKLAIAAWGAPVWLSYNPETCTHLLLWARTLKR